ncbi:MAG: hypothetical protein QOD06_1346 [Candidatus Binatota bacterium]|jgi:hypothetical protein|nr:hypothetical protein [Candidatus Binatota bacterium]
MDETATTGSAPGAWPGGGIVSTAIRVLTEPKRFFASMPRDGGFEEPAVFALVMLIASAVIHGLWVLLTLAFGAFLTVLVLTALFGAIGLVIGAGILYFLSRALGGDAQFESSFRIAAFATVLTPVSAVASIVPLLTVLVSAYGVYLVIIALVTVDRVPEGRAWAVVGGLGVLLLIASMAAVFVGGRAAAGLERWGGRLEQTPAD